MSTRLKQVHQQSKLSFYNSSSLVFESLQRSVAVNSSSVGGQPLTFYSLLCPGVLDGDSVFRLWFLSYSFSSSYYFYFSVQLQLQLFISVTITAVTFVSYSYSYFTMSMTCITSGWYVLLCRSIGKTEKYNYRRDHIKPVLIQLHWLPISKSAIFNDRHNGIQDQTDTWTITLGGFDR